MYSSVPTVKRTRTVLSPEQSPSEVQRAIRKKSKVKQGRVFPSVMFFIIIQSFTTYSTESANDVQAAIPLFLTESGPSTGSQPFPLTQLAQSNSLSEFSIRATCLKFNLCCCCQKRRRSVAVHSECQLVLPFNS